MIFGSLCDFQSVKKIYVWATTRCRKILSGNVWNQMTSMLLMAVKLACAGNVRIAQSMYEAMGEYRFRNFVTKFDTEEWDWSKRQDKPLIVEIGGKEIS